MRIYLRDPLESFHRTWRAFLPLRLTSPQMRISLWYQFSNRSDLRGSECLMSKNWGFNPGY